MPDRDTVKLQRRLKRLGDKADGIISKKVGINCSIKLLMRKDDQLTKEWGKTIKEIQEIRKQLGEVTE